MMRVTPLGAMFGSATLQDAAPGAQVLHEAEHHRGLGVAGGRWTTPPGLVAPDSSMWSDPPNEPAAPRACDASLTRAWG
jgi:hypothetical protein